MHFQRQIFESEMGWRTLSSGLAPHQWQSWSHSAISSTSLLKLILIWMTGLKSYLLQYHWPHWWSHNLHLESHPVGVVHAWLRMPWNLCSGMCSTCTNACIFENITTFFFSFFFLLRSQTSGSSCNKGSLWTRYSESCSVTMPELSVLIHIDPLNPQLAQSCQVTPRTVLWLVEWHSTEWDITSRDCECTYSFWLYELGTQCQVTSWGYTFGVNLAGWQNLLGWLK